MTQPNQFQTWNKSSSVAPSYGNYYGRSKVDCGDEGAFNRSLQSACATDLSPHHQPAQNSSTLLQQQLNEPLLPFSATPNNLLDYSQPPAKANHKFTLFTKLSNFHKLNAFDSLLNSSGTVADFGDVEDLSSDEKRQGLKKLLEQAMSDETKAQIAIILEKIGLLSPSEKMLLYLRMPGSFTEADPLKQSQNPLGSRSEISHTINWVRSHLETDLNVSIPKQEVYEDYVAYCARINIKCLSTADFGKVMKQVFPNIRPRRLGTRGHSRYCYAAMRKATKLKPPILPDLSNKEDPMAKEMEKEESSWNVVKGWSENLLSTKFETVNDLAGYITENSLNNSVNATSRSLLQKKILQRELKEKKKMNTQNLKKRRKKRKKTVSACSISQPDYSGLEIKLESEIEAIDDDMPGNLIDDLSDSANDMLPINLTNQDQSQGENVIMNNIPSLSCDIPATNSNEGLSYDTPDRSTSFTEKYDDPVEEIVENIYCKKVRQAQQTKNAMALQEQPKSISAVVDPSEIQTQMLMPSKIPAKRKLKKDPYMQLKKNKYQLQTEDGQLQVEPSDLLLKKDDLKEQFILPRERFISICNMDKNSLDNYLNANEENSQDLELLQYFNDEKNNNEPIEEDEDDLGPPTTSVPILENYHLFSSEARKDAKTCEKLSQLRSMLEQNIQSSNQNQQNSQNSINQQHMQGESTIKSLLLNKSPSSSNDLNLYGGPASASLALMSQRHNPQVPPTSQNQVKNFSNGSNVPQSPNTRRKNFSFVPIPQNTQNSQNSRVKNLNMNPVFKNDQKCPNVSPFVSPRATPSFKRSTGSNNMNSHSNLTLLQVPSNSHSFSQSQDFKAEPVSAPPSPSMSQNFHFGSQSNHSNFQFQPLNHMDPNMAFPVESRSQSVPPNNNPYNVDFASICSSMNPTPVPSEYADFSDSNILDIFNNEPPRAIKMEATGMLYDIIDLQQNQSSDVSSSMGINNSFLSRSVPTTPLPYHHTYNGTTNNSCNMQNGKSVPGTPMNHTNPFRYSPDLQHARDILINGLTHHNNNNTNNNNVSKFSKQIPNLNLPVIQPVPTLDEINDLANFDSSNILNNL